MRQKTQQTEEGTATNQSLFGLHHHDTRSLLSYLQHRAPETAIADGFVDVTITSPPYSDQKDYGYDEDLQVGFGDSYEEYLEGLRDIFRQTYAVTRDTGTLWVVANTVKRDGRTVQLPFDIADVCENLEGKTACDECGQFLRSKRESAALVCTNCGWTYDPRPESWVLQDVVIWDKVRARPWSSKGSMRNIFEYILCFSKTDDFVFDLDSIRLADPSKFKEWWVDYPHRYNPHGKLPDNIWQMVTPSQGAYGDGTLDHPAPFPPQLVERITRLTSSEGDVVFDPFAGTGTVLAQAEAMNRSALGFELSEEYVDAYPTVRRSIAEKFSETTSSIEAEQMKLKELICGLREVRYARELVRMTRQELDSESLDELGINSVMQFSRGLDDSNPTLDRHYVEDDYYVVLDDGVTDQAVDTLQSMLKTVSQSSPCSTFGIDATVYAGPASALLSDLSEWSGTPLYLYNDDTQYRYAKEYSLSEIALALDSPSEWRAENAHRQHPPIISNVGLQVSHPKKDTTLSESAEHHVTRRYPERESSTVTLD
ncbi:DNA-methyltransferase [Salinigranum halophilum]|uniref:DNA-methyltransferase n=1 Tax=Salinigranum halophilum TaxID=2565931 RepID=UPI0013758F52|nr:DNA methyltransferase [Salinigranum halophilum]